MKDLFHRYLLWGLTIVALSLIALSSAAQDTVSVEETVYGSHCGWGGIDPVGRVVLESMVANGDEKGIREMMHSENTALQAYGVEGLLRLQRYGTLLTSDDLARLEELQRSEAQVLTCIGCIHMRMRLSECLDSIIARLQN